MSFMDVFKSQEQRLFERGVSQGLSYHEAHRRASGAVNSGMTGDEARAFVTTGSSCEAYRRAHGVQELGFRGVAKDVYMQTGSVQRAYEAQRKVDSWQD